MTSKINPVITSISIPARQLISSVSIGSSDQNLKNINWNYLNLHDCKFQYVQVGKDYLFTATSVVTVLRSNGYSKAEVRTIKNWVDKFNLVTLNASKCGKKKPIFLINLNALIQVFIRSKLENIRNFTEKVLVDLTCIKYQSIRFAIQKEEPFFLQLPESTDKVRNQRRIKQSKAVTQFVTDVCVESQSTHLSFSLDVLLFELNLNKKELTGAVNYTLLSGILRGYYKKNYGSWSRFFCVHANRDVPSFKYISKVELTHLIITSMKLQERGFNRLQIKNEIINS